MSKLYFTRHGQTIWNVEGKVCGATDIELTELGHEQAKELGEHIKADKDIKIDEIVASPLVRAKNTVRIYNSCYAVVSYDKISLILVLFHLIQYIINSCRNF